MLGGELDYTTLYIYVYSGFHQHGYYMAMLDSISLNKTVLSLCCVVVYISNLTGYAFTGFAVLYIKLVSRNVFYHGRRVT